MHQPSIGLVPGVGAQPALTADVVLGPDTHSECDSETVSRNVQVMSPKLAKRSHEGITNVIEEALRPMPPTRAGSSETES